MADEDIKSMGVRVAMEDSSFNQGMTNLKKQLSIIDSEFKASVAGVKNWGDSLNGLKANASALGDKINVQKQIVQQYQEQLNKSEASLSKNSQAMLDLKGKVESAKTAWEQSKNELGANDEATKKLKDDYDKLNEQYKQSEKAVLSNNKSIEGYTIQLNNAKGKLSSMESELNKTNEQIKNQSNVFAQVKEKLGVNVQNIKVALGTIGIAVGGFLKTAIDEAKEAGNSQANLEQTIKSTGGAAGMTAKQLEELASKMQTMTTFDDDAIKSGESMLLTFTKIGKDVFPQATQTLLDMSQKMGTDTKNQAIQLGKALNDPIKGITALTRVGVTFSDQQKEQIKTMMKHNDIIGAQKLILSELNKEFGGQAAAAASTYEGKQKQVANQFKEIKESIGNALLPVLASLGKYLVQILQPIAKFISEHPKVTAGILAVIAVVGTLVGGLTTLTTITQAFGITLKVSMLPTIGIVMAAIAGIAVAAALIITHWTPIKAFFTNLWSSIKTTTESAWNGIKTFFTNIWNEIKNIVQSIWNGIVTVVMAIISPFINGITNLFSNMKTGLTNIFNGLKEYLSGIWLAIKTVILGPVLLIIDLVTGNFTKLSTDAQGIFNNLKKAFSLIWDGIKKIFTGEVQAIAGFLKTEWDGIKNVITTVWNGIKNFFGTIWNGITGVIKTAWNGIAKFLSNPEAIFNAIKAGWDSAINWIKNLPAEALQWGKDIIQGLIDGIKSMISKIGDAVSGIADKIRSFLHFSKPDEGPLKDYESWMPDFMTGLAESIKNSKYLVQNAIKGLSTDMAIGIKYNAISNNMPNIPSNGNSQKKVIYVQKGAVQINAKDIKELNDLYDIIGNIDQTVNSGVVYNG